MGYATKEQDHAKRTAQEGMYSTYNHMYKYLCDNYEPAQLDNMPSMALESLERKLLNLGRQYSVKGNKKYNDQELVQDAKQAICNFIDNNKSHGDTAHNFGKGQQAAESFSTVRDAMQDLRW